MFDILTWLALLGGLFCLYKLWIIDLEQGLLPNEYVLGFFMSACLLHLATAFAYLTPSNMALGAFIGGASLYVIREVAALYYRKDALGWGDIKLMAAAGALLGPHHIVLALALGALAGILHGLLLYIRSNRTISLGSLSLPAGPGFIVGIIAASLIFFHVFQDIS